MRSNNTTSGRPQNRIRLRVVVDPHRLMESNFRAVYRITLMEEHL
jgi:hypothetical protein